jgi:hypothetical protein
MGNDNFCMSQGKGTERMAVERIEFSITTNLTCLFSDDIIVFTKEDELLIGNIYFECQA